MAKKSVLNRNAKRVQTVQKYRELRLSLKETIRSPKSKPEEKQLALSRLQQLPRDASPVRVCERCRLTGRGRGVFRRFGLGRNVLRDIAMRGEIPGVVKASW